MRARRVQPLERRKQLVRVRHVEARAVVADRDGRGVTGLLARDGVEAIEYLLDDAKPLPDLVLLDLKLPRLSGLEVLQRIRTEERTKMLPVVVLTSSSQDEDIVSSYRMGANSYVRKPVRFSDFSEAVRQLGVYWLLINESANRSF